MDLDEAVQIIIKRQRVVFENKENGYGVYRCRTKNRNTITVRAYDMPAGTCWLVATGVWVRDPKYGQQFDIQYTEMELPTTHKAIVEALCGLKAGLGKARAENIYKTFGSNIWDVLTQTPSDLMGVSGMTRSVYQKLLKRWNSITIKKELMLLFKNAPEFTARNAAMVADALGEDALENVKKNPYLLIRLAHMEFRSVDRAALKIEGVTAIHPGRVASAIFFVLSSAEKRGHVCYPLNFLCRDALKQLNAAYSPQKLTKETMIECIKQLNTMGRIKIKAGEAPYIKKDESCGYAQTALVYLTDRYNEEERLVTNLVRLMSAPVKDANYARLMIDDVLKRYTKETGITLAEEQVSAALGAFTHPVSVITGGPGTGKTTLTKAILEMDRFLSGNDSCPLLLAPTGRAARKLSEATGHAAFTVHHAIGYTGEETFLSTESDSEMIQANMIIFDEVSMLDQMIAAWTLKKIESGTRVIFIGDPDQLPSVGAGNVLEEIIRSGVVPTTRLDVIFRQDGTNPIVTNAAKIRNVQTDLVFKPGSFISRDAHTEQAQLDAAVTTYLQCAKRFGVDNVMLLNPYKKEGNTVVNTGEMNRRIQNALNPLQEDEPYFKSQRCLFHTGDRVMQLKNTEYVNNGDVGTIVGFEQKQEEDDEDQTYQVMNVDFGDGMILQYAAEDLNQLDLAYSSTIHKSQGNEYLVVIVVLSNHHANLLKRNLVYTAITRSTKYVALIGDITGPNSALVKAIHHTASVRYTLLASRLKEAWKTNQYIA